MYVISKEFKFAAAHSLMKLPAEHPCTTLHGHNYTVILTLKSETLNNADMVKDYRDMEDFKDWMNSHLDHKNINDVFPVNTTSENMAKFIYDLWKQVYSQLYSVTIKETDKTTAIYYE